MRAHPNSLSSKEPKRWGAHFSLQPTRYQRLLHDAWYADSFIISPPKRAYVEEAAELEPDAYQPYLFASTMSDHPGTELSRCLAENPLARGALLLFADHLASEGHIELSRREPARGRRDSPFAATKPKHGDF